MKQNQKANKTMELDLILNKINKNLKTLEEFPHISKNGIWVYREIADWANGFWPGILWHCCKLTSDEEYAKAAASWLEKIRERRTEKTFDLGFLFYPAFAIGYMLTNYEHLKNIALEAADTLSTFFNRKAGFVYSDFTIEGKKVGRTIIDVMMNLPLLWWAYEETDDERYYEVAYTHSNRTIEEFIRNDYSTFHVIDFDLETGSIIRKITVQGYGNDSCWSRGQAWAIYGFAMAYKTSKDKKFLETTKNLADYFIRNLPEDYVPYWDFNDSKIPNAPKDSSAAAIACCGLMTLFELTKKKKFRHVGLRILNSLSSNYLEEKNRDGILTHGCFHKPMNIGVNESLIWGDYYFMEALMKTSGEEI